MGCSWGGGSTIEASASVGPEEARILGEGTDDGKGIAATTKGEEEGCGNTTGGGMGTITGGGVGTITEGGVGTIGRRGVGTKGGRGVGTIRGGGVGTITTGGVGTITGGGVGTLTGGGVASTIGTDEDGNGVAATPWEVDCKAALCVSARVDGVDVDGLARGTFIR